MTARKPYAPMLLAAAWATLAASFVAGKLVPAASRRFDPPAPWVAPLLLALPLLLFLTLAIEARLAASAGRRARLAFAFGTFHAIALAAALRHAWDADELGRVPGMLHAVLGAFWLLAIAAAAGTLHGIDLPGERPRRRVLAVRAPIAGAALGLALLGVMQGTDSWHDFAGARDAVLWLEIVVAVIPAGPYAFVAALVGAFVGLAFLAVDLLLAELARRTLSRDRVAPRR